MFMKWPKIVKSYVNRIPIQKKILSPQKFYGFFENFSDCSHYPCENNEYLLLTSADIYHLLKARRYKICTLLKMEPRREFKLSGSNEYLCFETNNSRT